MNNSRGLYVISTLVAIIIVSSCFICYAFINREDMRHDARMNEEIKVYSRIHGEVEDIRYSGGFLGSDKTQLIIDKFGNGKKSILFDRTINFGFDIGHKISITLSKTCKRKNENKTPTYWNYEGYTEIINVGLEKKPKEVISLQDNLERKYGADMSEAYKENDNHVRIYLMNEKDDNKFGTFKIVSIFKENGIWQVGKNE